MRVDAFLADSAEVVQGKIYALGAGWNTIYVRSFPAAHRRLAVAATVHVPFTDTNVSHQFELKLLTEDGKEYPIGVRADAEGKPAPVRAMGGEFTLGRPPQLVDGDEQVACFAFTIDGLRFSEAGMFTWVVSIDGEEVSRLPMRVKQAQQQ
ncbi:hypothetical protein [Demequina sp. NBRC 110056]|uniref:DUF6941 family protein n=1 Tax=Demequina sp. NBRC 110056 TaxID=1570345 RepID=UPI000A01E56B|nr:hypothetical protein [Demequina sp. NBRC 110056]